MLRIHTLRQGYRKFVLAISALALLAGSPVQAADRLPDDTYFGEQWYLRHIGAPEAWNKSLGTESVIIAFIDTGIDIDHPDLKQSVWRNAGEIAGNRADDDGNGYVDDVFGWDFVGNDADPRPDISGDFTVVGANHGTVGAGVAAARGDNGRGITGVTWQSSIMAIRALDSNGSGDPGRVTRAVEYAVANGASVINLSFAGGTYSEELRVALRRAYDKGVFIVAAAGNAPEGGEAVNLDERPLYPVCLDAGSDENFIYGVASTDDRDVRASFSNYGATCVDGAAPGVRILSTQVYRAGQKYFDSPYGGFYVGTSVSAPIVSGTVALIRALDRNLTPKQITNILTESGVRIDDLNPGFFGKVGRGRVDAAKAVAAAAARLRPVVIAPPALTMLPPGTTTVVVTAPASGAKPEVRLFTPDGLFVRGFMAFPESFTGGVSVATGDFDGSRKDSIVVGALAGGSPQIRIFDINTRVLGTFMAYDPAFSGGVRVATGDLDGDGQDEIVTAAGAGGGPHVRIFGANGAVKGGFFAFDSRRRAGVDVAMGDLDGDGKAEIVASASDSATVRVFDARGILQAEFSPFGGARRGATQVAVAGRNVIVTSVARGVRTVSVFGLDGVQVATGTESVPPAEAAGLLAVGGRNEAPVVSMFSASAKPAFSFYAYDPKFRGGVHAALIE